ncbi:MAG: DUF4363 family protein [Syntrophomonadaceae bacterium]|jgi:dihydroorotase|nr:DUF4363 family protein [Syntrophomonadaceae bacterium]
MRLLTPLILILALIIGLGAWTNDLLEDSARELSQQIEVISGQIAEESWEEAVKHTNKLEETWEKEARWWPIFLEHQEIDNIEFALARTKEYVASENSSLARGHLSELKLMIEHIPEKEAVNLKNIL